MIMIQTTITPQQITRALASDWGPTLRRWAGALAMVYAAGLLAGEAWHALVAWINGHHRYGLARLGMPGGTAKDSSVVEAVSLTDEFTIRRLSQAPRPRHLTAVAPPRVNAVLLMAADGMSQRQIARALGISRHRVKAELEAA
jgi:hypothetical protein